jgi:hypothetical protein
MTQVQIRRPVRVTSAVQPDRRTPSGRLLPF